MNLKSRQKELGNTSQTGNMGLNRASDKVFPESRSLKFQPRTRLIVSRVFFLVRIFNLVSTRLLRAADPIKQSFKEEILRLPDSVKCLSSNYGELSTKGSDLLTDSNCLVLRTVC